MGSYCYLINQDRLIKTEAYKCSASGDFSGAIEEEENLVHFLEYCKYHNLKIDCVHESFLEQEFDKERYYRNLNVEDFYDTNQKSPS